MAEKSHALSWIGTNSHHPLHPLDLGREAVISIVTSHFNQRASFCDCNASPGCKLPAIEASDAQGPEREVTRASISRIPGEVHTGDRRARGRNPHSPPLQDPSGA